MESFFSFSVSCVLLFSLCLLTMISDSSGIGVEWTMNDDVGKASKVFPSLVLQKLLSCSLNLVSKV